MMTVEREKYNAHLTLRWRGGLLSEFDVPLPRSHPAPIRTADDTDRAAAPPGRALSRYRSSPASSIGRVEPPLTGLSFTANRVGSLRTHWKIPCFEPAEHTPDGDCMTIERAAHALGRRTLDLAPLAQ